MQLDMNTAKNIALRENVFMMAICIELRIPLFLVGKPGSSKSLAKSIIAKSMLGQGSQTKLLKSFKQVKVQQYNNMLLLSMHILTLRCAWYHTNVVSFQPQKLLLKCLAEPWLFSENKTDQTLLLLLYWMKWALLRILHICHWKLFIPCWRMALKVLTVLNRYSIGGTYYVWNIVRCQLIACIYNVNSNCYN